MSVEAISWALKQRVRSATHKAVLLVLANRMDPTGFGWPSQKLVGREANCSDRTVRRVLADLEEDGVLMRDDRRRKNGSYTTDAVQFAMPVEPEDNLAAGPADNLTDGQIDQRPDTTEPADNLSYPTTFEPNTKNPKKVKATDKPPPTANLPKAIEAYNDAARRKGWVALKAFTEDRRNAARLAWKRLGGEAGWLALIAEAERQSFLAGSNDRGWRMDFDFFVSKRGSNHIAEGKYLTPEERTAAPTTALSSADLAAKRLAHFQATGTWLDDWGPRPLSQAQGAR